MANRYPDTNPSGGDELVDLLGKLLQIANNGSSGGGGVPVTLPSGTLSIFAKTAGQTETIPVGAFQIGVIFLTGTGTIGGVDWPVNLPFNLDVRTAAQIAVVCGSPGTARVQYLS